VLEGVQAVNNWLLILGEKSPSKESGND